MKFSKWLILLIVLLNIGCDQVSKEIVRDKIAPHQVIDVVEGHFELTKVENTGAFLSLGNDLSPVLSFLLLKLLPALVMLFMLGQVMLSNDFTPLAIFGYCLVIGGGLGNLIDRFLYGSVTDFMLLKFGGLRTGIFNVADMSIMAGVFILLYAVVIGRPKTQG